MIIILYYLTFCLEIMQKLMITEMRYHSFYFCITVSTNCVNFKSGMISN